jgi:hypothetical protein
MFLSQNSFLIWQYPLHFCWWKTTIPFSRRSLIDDYINCTITPAYYPRKSGNTPSDQEIIGNWQTARESIRVCLNRFYDFVKEDRDTIADLVADKTLLASKPAGI